MNYEDEYNYVVFKYNVYDTNFYIMSIDELPTTGFSSLYRFTQSTAEALKESGIAGFKGTVWSPTLAIDIDNDEQAMETDRRLQASGVEFSTWKTGNRGLHFYITRPHNPSHLLPQIDKEWVKSNLIGADLSIYTPLHMFRVPGTRHEKTGQVKCLFDTSPGKHLFLPDTVEMRQEQTYIQSSTAKECVFMNSYVMGMTVPHEEGTRHHALVNLGMYLKQIGEPIEFISRWLYHTNLLFIPQTPQEELERIIQFIDEATLNAL